MLRKILPFMKMLILHMRYRPDATGTGPLITDLALDLVDQGDEVTVICSAPHYGRESVPEAYRRGLIHFALEDGVRVYRTMAIAGKHGSTLTRAVNYLLYLVLSTLVALRIDRQEAVLAVSPPITVGITGLVAARRMRIPMILGLQDIWPDGLIAMRRLNNKLMIRLLHRYERFLYRNSDAIIVLSGGMKRMLLDRDVPEEKVHVIPNWIDLDVVFPTEKNNPFRERFDFQDKFVVLFAGNLGYAAALEFVLHAAERLKDVPSIRFLLVGEGSVKSELIRLTEEYHLPNVIFETTQPVDQISNVYGSADLSLVTLRSNMGSISVPSKTFSIMASERPVLASVPKDSEVWSLVTETDCGSCVSPEDPSALAAKIIDLQNQPEQLKQWGKNGRNFVADHFSRRQLTVKYRELLKEVDRRGD